MEVQSALRSLSGRFTDVKYTATEEDREVVYDLAEDIRDAISEYQVSGYLGVVNSPAGQFTEVSGSFRNRRTSMSRAVYQL